MWHQLTLWEKVKYGSIMLCMLPFLLLEMVKGTMHLRRIRRESEEWNKRDHNNDT